MNLQEIQDLLAENLHHLLIITTVNGEQVTEASHSTPLSRLFTHNKAVFTDMIDKYKSSMSELTSSVILDLTGKLTGLQAFVCPIFESKTLKYFLWCGPIVENERKLQQWQEKYGTNEEITLPILNQVQKIETRNKLASLSALISENLSFVKHQKNLNERLVFIEKLITVQAEIETMMKVLIDGVDADFYGFAKRNEQGVFEIKVAKGIEEEAWKGRTFFEGEGFLGQTAFTKELLFWKQISHDPRSYFFQEMDLYPESLLCFPVLAGNENLGVIFAGYCKNSDLTEADILYWRLIAKIIGEKINEARAKERLRERSLEATVFIEMGEGLEQVHNLTEASLLLIDKVLTNTGFLPAGIFLNQEGVFLGRGMSHEEKLMLQTKIFDEYQHPQKLKFASKGNTLEIPYYEEEKLQFVFTIQFKSRENLAQHHQFISKIITLWYKLASPYFKLDDYEKAIIPLLVTMKEWNPLLYEKSQRAAQLVARLVEKVKLDQEEAKKVTALSMVIGCKSDLLESTLANTSLQPLLLNVSNQITKKGQSSYSKSTQLLALLKTYIQKKDVTLLSSIEPSLIDIFLQVIDEVEYDIHEEEVPIVNEISDIQTTIASLPISPREQEVLYLILEGLNNQEIAERLFISIHTVKNHLTKVFSKLGVADRNQAMAMIYRIKFTGQNNV